MVVIMMIIRQGRVGSAGGALTLALTLAACAWFIRRMLEWIPAGGAWRVSLYFAAAIVTGYVLIAAALFVFQEKLLFPYIPGTFPCADAEARGFRVVQANGLRMLVKEAKG